MKTRYDPTMTRWTTERPHCEGWFWCLAPNNPVAFVLHFSELGGVIVSDISRQRVNGPAFDDFCFGTPGPIEEPRMTAQADADEIGHQIGEIRRASGEAMTDEAFGRINRDAYMEAIGTQPYEWTNLTDEGRRPWISSAAAVRKAEQELVKGANP